MKDEIILINVDDFADGFDAIIRAEMLSKDPLLVDADLNHTDLTPDQRNIVAALMMLGLYNDKGIENQYILETNYKEISAVKTAVDAFYSRISCSAQELMEILASIMRIIKDGKIHDFAEKVITQ